MDKARILVDFNELMEENLVLLSKTDIVTYSDGTKSLLKVGLPVFIYEYNAYNDGTKEYLFAEGIAELNEGRWGDIAKWCCRINANGIITNDIA